MGNVIAINKMIADIINPEKNANYLINLFKRKDFNWESVVKIGSEHLVLPTIYCRLIQKNLVEHIPSDLNKFLKEITDINRNRNTSILKQIKEVSRILNTNKIEHVFLKGSSMLASGIYEDYAERMIGDIDILVNEIHIKTAFELLQKNGYSKTYGYSYKRDDFRHLDRLISDNKLAAIELHKKLLNKTSKKRLNPNIILRSKQYINDVWVCDKQSLNDHIVLGWQINDYGHYFRSINIKYLNDIILINHHLDQNLENRSTPYTSFFIFGKLYFDHFKLDKNLFRNKYYYISYFAHNKYIITRYPLRLIKTLYNSISKRLSLVIKNKHYRRHILEHKIFPKINSVFYV